MKILKIYTQILQGMPILFSAILALLYLVIMCSNFPFPHPPQNLSLFIIVIMAIPAVSPFSVLEGLKEKS